MRESRVSNRVALLAGAVAMGITAHAFADAKANVTASMDGGTTKSGNTWYQQGYNAEDLTSGLWATDEGVFNGESDATSTFQFQPYTGNNVLLLDNATKTGTLNLINPTTARQIAIPTSSGN